MDLAEPRLDSGVANSVAKEGEAPEPGKAMGVVIGVELVGAVKPTLLVPTEKIGAVLINDVNIGEAMK